MSGSAGLEPGGTKPCGTGGECNGGRWIIMSWLYWKEIEMGKLNEIDYVDKRWLVPEGCVGAL